jgi:hypothetical protein
MTTTTTAPTQDASPKEACPQTSSTEHAKPPPDDDTRRYGFKDDAEYIAHLDRRRGLRSTLTAACEVAADQIDLDGDVDDPARGASTAHR